MGNKPIRILQVGMSPYYGGTESFVMNQYRRIDKTLVQFDFLNVYNEKIACQDEIEALGGKIYYLSMARHNGLKEYYKNLDNFFKENAKNFDGIHCNFQSLINIDALKYAKKYNISVRIAHAHNAGYGTEPNILQKLIIKKNLSDVRRCATDYFACSTLAADWMFKRDAIVINNAIDAKKFSYNEETRKRIRKELNLEDKFVLMCVGRLDPQKNPIFMLEVFKELLKIKPEAKLVSIGDGVLKEEMLSKIEELGIGENVIMLGNRSDVNELLQGADVFFLPSRFEGLGIVFVEAQAAGLPCFTSAKVVPSDVNVTGLVTFIDLECSLQEWAKKIAVADINNRRDTLEEIEKAGYDNEENARKLQELYLKIIESPKG